jgi:hypothetical protein
LVDELVRNMIAGNGREKAREVTKFFAILCASSWLPCLANEFHADEPTGLGRSFVQVCTVEQWVAEFNNYFRPPPRSGARPKVSA